MISRVFSYVQAASAGLTLVGAFYVYNMFKGKSLDAATSDLKVPL